MAYRKLAIILENQDRDPERAQEAFTKAYELRDRLTERERYLAEAAYHSYVERDNEASIAAYRTLLEKYPTDRIALNNLAVGYGALGRREDAAELYVRSIAQGGAPAVTFTNAIATLYDLGYKDSAAAVLQRFAEEYPGQPQVVQFRAAFRSAEFDYAGAEREMRALREAQRGNPMIEMTTVLALANHAAVQGRVEEAQSLIREAFDVQERYGMRFIDQSWEVFEAVLTSVLSIRYYGEPGPVVATLDRVRRSTTWRGLDPEDRDYLTLATLYAYADRPDRARELVERYQAEVPDRARNTAAAKYALHDARGAIAMAEDRAGDAVVEYRQAREQLPACGLCSLPELGEAYVAVGQRDSAMVAFRRYLDTPVLNRSGLDNVNLWIVIRRLGELHEAAGDRELALEYYDRFVELWENAEPRLQPQVAEIRERMARLVGESR